MYDHMNNSVYNFLYVDISVAASRDTPLTTHGPVVQLRLCHQLVSHGPLRAASAHLGSASAHGPHALRLLRCHQLPQRGRAVLTSQQAEQIQRGLRSGTV